jgi:hypothetical protein
MSKSCSKVVKVVKKLSTNFVALGKTFWQRAFCCGLKLIQNSQKLIFFLKKLTQN